MSTVTVAIIVVAVAAVAVAIGAAVVSAPARKLAATARTQVEESERILERMEAVRDIPPAPRDEEISCSFCRKGRADVRFMVASPTGAAICDECAELCTEIIHEENAKPQPPKVLPAEAKGNR